MKYIIFILSFILSACATKYSFEIAPDGTVKGESSSYREAEFVDTSFEKKGSDYTFKLKAKGVTDDTAEAATAIVSTTVQEAADTGQIWLQGGPFKDSLGLPRQASAEELALQYKLETEKE